MYVATTISEKPTSHSQSMARAQIGMFHISVTFFFKFIFTVFFVGSKPTLPHIPAFPFKTGVDNIVQKIAGSRDIFGVLLLEDDDGSIVSDIAAPNQSPSGITLAIIRHWIQGNGRQPISWGTLIDTVQKAGFSALADDIREGLENLQ